MHISAKFCPPPPPPPPRSLLGGISFAWCLPCGYNHIIPYFYAIYFGVLLGKQTWLVSTGILDMIPAMVANELVFHLFACTATLCCNLSFSQSLTECPDFLRVLLMRTPVMCVHSSYPQCTGRCAMSMRAVSSTARTGRSTVPL